MKIKLKTQMVKFRSKQSGKEEDTPRKNLRKRKMKTKGNLHGGQVRTQQKEPEKHSNTRG